MYKASKIPPVNIPAINIKDDFISRLAYLHAETSFDGYPGTGSWRTRQYAKNIGNLYPTHGLGPVAQYMSLARKEDSFKKIVSLSSPSKGRYLMA